MYDQQKKEALMDMSKEIKYSAVHVDFLSDRDVEILTKIGIPDSLSPYIDIESEEKFGGYSLFDRVNFYEKYPLDNEAFKGLCLIGRCGDGYIVITRDGEVKFFAVATGELLPINMSLDAFLDCAYKYSQFVDSIQEKYGDGAYIDGEYSEEDVDSLKDALSKIDETAVEEGFWADELVNLIDSIES